MNQPRRNDPWSRLVAAARQAPSAAAESVPAAFVTRVTARARAAGERAAWGIERLAWRALGVACLLALASAALNYRALETSESGAEVVSVADPMSVLLDT